MEKSKYFDVFKVKQYSGINNQSYNYSRAHSFRQSIPDNVDASLSDLNFAIIPNDKKDEKHNYNFKKITNVNKAYEIVKNEHHKNIDLIKKDFDQQQELYSPSKKKNFNDYCNSKNTSDEIVITARQEWFEEQGMCKFTNHYVSDPKGGQRKMGKIIPDSIDQTKFNKWAKTQVNFMKIFLEKRIGTSIGINGASVQFDETTPHIHIFVNPITKRHSKTLDQERYIFSHNQLFGNPKSMQQMLTWHANYMTKSGFPIQRGIIGGRGSYNALSFKEVKELERRKAEQQLSMFLLDLQSQKENFSNYQQAMHYKNYYDIKIQEIKKYLLLTELTDYEKNQLQHYLILLDKVRYYKIINNGFNTDPNKIKELEYYDQELDEMTIKLGAILTKGYKLII